MWNEGAKKEGNGVAEPPYIANLVLIMLFYAIGGNTSQFDTNLKILELYQDFVKKNYFRMVRNIKKYDQSGLYSY